MTNLERLRQEVNRMDAEVVRILQERAEITRRIGAEKGKTGVAVRDPAREAEVMARVKAMNAGRLPEPLLESVYRRIFEMCIEVQKEERS